MKNSHALISCLLVSTLAVSCAKKVQTKSASLLNEKSAESLAVAGQTTEAAAVYSRMGELMLSNPAGTVYAHQLFSRALELNKHDSKANLYSALISPVLVTQGFTKRFNSLLSPEQKEKLKLLEARVLEEGIQELIDFSTKLGDGKENVTNFKDAKKFLVEELTAELEKSSEKLNAITEKNFRIGLMKNSENKSIERSCTQVEDAWTCSENIQKPALSIPVDLYDIKALRATLKTYETELKLVTLFNIDDLQSAHNAAKSQLISSDKEAVALLAKYPQLLKIESKDQLRTIFNNTEAILNDMLDFSTMYETLCNETRSEHGPGPICVSQEQASQLIQLISLVAGPNEFTIGVDQDGNDVNIIINLRAMEKSSFAGLQQLLPTKFDENGRAIDIKDKTFGGLFPDSDLLEELQSVKKIATNKLQNK